MTSVSGLGLVLLKKEDYYSPIAQLVRALH
jgi:hypothetical protein